MELIYVILLLAGIACFLASASGHKKASTDDGVTRKNSHLAHALLPLGLALVLLVPLLEAIDRLID